MGEFLYDYNVQIQSLAAIVFILSCFSGLPAFFLFIRGLRKGIREQKEAASWTMDQLLRQYDLLLEEMKSHNRLRKDFEALQKKGKP